MQPEWKGGLAEKTVAHRRVAVEMKGDMRKWGFRVGLELWFQRSYHRRGGAGSSPDCAA